MCVTHEQFIQSVADAAIARLPEEEHAAFEGIKLVYGAGQNGVRGITYYHKWRSNGCDHAKPFVEIAAFTQENWVQVAGTTIHELGHVLAGFEAGHGKKWKDACKRLGLRRALAAGQTYMLAYFAPDIRNLIAQLPKPDEGEPVAHLPMGGGGRAKPRACPTGIGTRGGKSRGAGSGSRLIKVACAECGYTARVTRKWLDIGAPHCPLHGEMAEA